MNINWKVHYCYSQSDDIDFDIKEWDSKEVIYNKLINYFYKENAFFKFSLSLNYLWKTWIIIFKYWYGEYAICSNKAYLNIEAEKKDALEKFKNYRYNKFVYNLAKKNWIKITKIVNKSFSYSRSLSVEFFWKENNKNIIYNNRNKLSFCQGKNSLTTFFLTGLKKQIQMGEETSLLSQYLFPHSPIYSFTHYFFTFYGHSHNPDNTEKAPYYTQNK